MYPLFHEDSETLTFIYLKHYGWDELEKIFTYLAQALHGDVRDIVPERPPVTQVDNRIRWDYWIQVEGMSKKEARAKFLEVALPIMERAGA